MALSTKLELRQGQQLVMTPQLQQAIRLLQLSNMDLAQYVESELERKTKDAIERRTGKSALIEKHINPRIIGGMVMIAGGQIIDGSIRSQLAELQQDLLEARVN